MPAPWLVRHQPPVAARIPGAIRPLILWMVIFGVAMAPGWAAGPIALAFVPHGTFFSAETHQPVALDPQVFVPMPGAPAGAGPQGITHIAGFIPARLSAPPETALYTAEGTPLHTTLGQWLGARGTADVEPTEARGERVTVSVTGLIAGGTYSLFVVTFGPGGNTFAPLDGHGTSNTFVAIGRGTGRATVVAPTRLTQANAILLVYHSDGRAHGRSRGVPGVTAHHQLIARMP